MFSSFLARVRSWFRGGIRRPADLDAEMKEEFRLHLELRTEDLIRQGFSPALAARTARLEFGSTDHYVDSGRAARGLERLDDFRISILDLRLGFRMLARYPGITIMGGLAMAFAVWIGAGVFELAQQVMSPTLPIPDGSRVVGIVNWDAAGNRAEPRITRDFLHWQRELQTIDEIGAFRIVQRTLITDDGRGETVPAAEMTASAFRIARVPALVGRGITPDDERADAPPVAVIGYGVWQTRFNADSAILGRSVRLANARVTIVGVMPKGFAYPVSQDVWIPLRLDPTTPARQGARLMTIGRLGAHATMRDAQNELTLIGARMAAESRETHERLRPRVMPFAQTIVPVSGWAAVAVGSSNIPALLLAALLCGNVALLMFARAASREREIVVRNALGASRRRIVMQLFGEALVLGAIATAIGLAGVGPGLEWVTRAVGNEILNGARLPYWFQARVSAVTVLYAVLLTIFAAVMAGVVPGLKVTRGIGERLKQSSAGTSSLRFGGIWTAIIVLQIAVTVAFPFVTLSLRSDAQTLRRLTSGVADEQYLTFRLDMDRDALDATADTTRATFERRYAQAYTEFTQRLVDDGGAAGIAFADHLPRMYHPHRMIQLDEGPAAPLNPMFPDGYRVGAARVGPDFFNVLDAPALTGRTFYAGDFATAEDPTIRGSKGGAVIVNESFVTLVLGGANPIGRRFRYIQFEETSPRRPPDVQRQPWYEIVGVVRDMGLAAAPDPKVAGIYHPATNGQIYPASLAIRTTGSPAEYASKVRSIAAVNPSLRLNDVLPMNRLNDAELEFYDFWLRMLVSTSAIVLMLSLAGIYAVMSFTVSRRTREIGVRVALGADSRGVVLAVFRKPLTQVVSGVVGGIALLFGFAFMASGGLPKLELLLGIGADAVIMLGLCSLACVVPTRRALAVQPTEALRQE